MKLTSSLALEGGVVDSLRHTTCLLFVSYGVWPLKSTFSRVLAEYLPHALSVRVSALGFARAKREVASNGSFRLQNFSQQGIAILRVRLSHATMDRPGRA
ncbi:hypothetical protein [Sulfobacillus thermosulfidooxidans]|uniref:hypothetical protein n=1 Tax=Sulfobacillus thermosulfidooxidans TaxID=28034 RepID=UPI0011127CB9|nr:hypothetical protein [Sulfobacillus thermosulfidooxidans]